MREPTYRFLQVYLLCRRYLLLIHGQTNRALMTQFNTIIRILVSTGPTRHESRNLCDLVLQGPLCYACAICSDY